MVSNNVQASAEAQALPAAASIEVQMPVEFSTIPAEIRQEVDRLFRSLLGLNPGTPYAFRPESGVALHIWAVGSGGNDDAGCACGVKVWRNNEGKKRKEGRLAG